MFEATPTPPASVVADVARMSPGKDILVDARVLYQFDGVQLDRGRFDNDTPFLQSHEVRDSLHELRSAIGVNFVRGQGANQ